MLEELSLAARGESANEELLEKARRLIAKLKSEREVQQRIAVTAPLCQLSSFKDLQGLLESAQAEKERSAAQAAAATAENGAAESGGVALPGGGGEAGAPSAALSTTAPLQGLLPELPGFCTETEEFERWHEDYKRVVETAAQDEISGEFMSVALEQLAAIEHLLMEKKQIEQEDMLKLSKKKKGKKM
jgi:hypothetical protein